MALQRSRSRPLVSAIVSTYNAERLLGPCLDDLESQTIADRLEIIVIDSGSRQDERAVVRRYQERYPNIVYRRTPRETLYAAWNRGIRLSRAKYVTNANTDDAHRSDALELLCSALEAHPEADLAYADYEWTSVANDTFADPHGYRVARHPPYHPAQAMFFCVTGCHPVWRRTVFDRLGWFDPTFVAPGDFEFFIRFATAGLRAVHVPEVLSLFFQNRDGLTSTWAAREIRRLYGPNRKKTRIEQLYRVDPRRPGEVALAWTAQGNLALNCAIPYGDDAVADWDYATHCYRRALARDPRCVPALRNLVVACIGRGHLTPIASMLAKLPAEVRDDLRSDLRAGRLRLAGVEVAPAVDPLQFPDVLPGRPHAPRWIELPGLSAATRALARRVSGAAAKRSRPERTRRLSAEIRRLTAMRGRTKGRAARAVAAALEARRRERDTLKLLLQARTRRARERLIPRIAPRAKIIPAADGSVAWDRTGQRVHYLNRTAALIVELCRGRNRWGDIPDLVQRAYDVPFRPTRDVDRVLTALIDDGLLELGRPPSHAAVARSGPEGR